MATNPPDPTPSSPSKLQSMVARLRGIMQSLKPAESVPANQEEVLPTWDAPPTSGGRLSNTSSPATPVAAASETADLAEAVEATPVEADFSESTGTTAVPITPPEIAEPVDVPMVEPASAADVEPPSPAPPSEAETVGESYAADVASSGAAIEPAAPPEPCPCCQALRRAGSAYCDDCGYFFPPSASGASHADKVETSAPAIRIAGRYELGKSYLERTDVVRYRALDYGDGSAPPVPVIVVRMPVPAAAEIVPSANDTPADEADGAASPDVQAPFASTGSHEEDRLETIAWPSIAWEQNLLEAACDASLPAVLDHQIENGQEYLILEVPNGKPLWDAWDDPDATAKQRFGWLKNVAEAMHHLHGAGALFETLRPEMVVVASNGCARLTDLSELLPLPLPASAPIRGTLYTAPELAACHPNIDARADLYTFGAMLYSLHVGHELTEMDFERPGTPKPFIPRFPDIHPLFGRLVAKTFCREPAVRFPSDEAAKEDPTGFTELIQTLEVCQRTLDDVRLEISAWTTTGMVRTGNEDAFALLHAVESRENDTSEAALVLLADGMGGYEAGEVAAALAIQAMRKNLLQQKPFAALAGEAASPIDALTQIGGKPRAVDSSELRRLLIDALKDANKQIYNASRSGVGRRGMGCTAEVVFIQGGRLVVGHVGDSRTYHFHDGRLIQVTRDQTLVNRLVELGQLSEEEAENHPRRNELQQALGGQPDVDPGVYDGLLKSGDWVIVCSDGVSNHVTSAMFKEMLQNEAASAETAARRLVNLVNIQGATDNATIVVVRAT